MNETISSRLPFSFTTKIQQDLVSLSCVKVLRYLHGKRLVCLAEHGDQRLVVKFFYDKKRAKHHFLRELLGAKALVNIDVGAPRIIVEGELSKEDNGKLFDYLFSRRDHVYFIGFEYVENKGTLFEYLKKQREDSAEVIKKFLCLVAKMHESGIAHGDIHFNNFLVTEKQIVPLDGDTVSVKNRPLTKYESFHQLAQIMAFSPKYNNINVDQYLHEYFVQKSVVLTEKDYTHIRRLASKKNKKVRNDFLGKTLRNCSSFSVTKRFNKFVSCVRELKNALPHEKIFYDELYAQANQEDFLKEGNTCTVLRWQQKKPYVVKRYNLKSFFHACSRAFRNTRARESWVNAHRLQFYGINTPKPIMLFEVRWGWVRRQAYFITEYVSGQDIISYFKKISAQDLKSDAVFIQIQELFARFKALKIIHGDCKGSNFIVRENELLILDLDALKQYRLSLLFKREFKKDIERFLKNFEDEPELHDEMKRALYAL